MNAADIAQWVELIGTAVRTAIRIGRNRGLDIPGDREAKLIANAVNDLAAQMLPGSIEGLNALVQAARANIEREIAKLGEVERCGKCGGVLTIRSEVTPGGGPSTRTTSCDFCSGKAA